MSDDRQMQETVIDFSIPIPLKKILSAPNLVRQYNEVNKDYLKNEYCSDILLNFSDYLTKNIKEDNLTNFYNNINNLNIVFGTYVSNSSGEYNPINNTILLNESDLERLNEILPHELFHLSSNYYDSKNIINYNGFGQFCEGLFIGIGLTEGYTQLLTERYNNPDFTIENAFSSLFTPYVIEMTCSEMIEKVIGKEKMMGFYFKSDLKGFINELRKYASSKEIINFIKNLDYLSMCLNESMANGSVSMLISRSFINLVTNELSFTKLISLRKMRNDVKQGLVSIDEFSDKLNSCVNGVDEYPFITEKSKEKIKTKLLELKKPL